MKGGSRRKSAAVSETVGSAIAVDIAVLAALAAGLFVAISVFYADFSKPAGPFVAGGLRLLLGAGMYVFPLTLLLVPVLILASDQARVRRWLALAGLGVLLTSLFGGLFDDPAGNHVFGGIIGDSVATAGQSAMGGFYAVLLVALALISIVAVGGRSVVQPAMWLAGAAGSLVGV